MFLVLGDGDLRILKSESIHSFGRLDKGVVLTSNSQYVRQERGKYRFEVLKNSIRRN